MDQLLYISQDTLLDNEKAIDKQLLDKISSQNQMFKERKNETMQLIKKQT
jgi:hypothetical protein